MWLVNVQSVLIYHGANDCRLRELKAFFPNSVHSLAYSDWINESGKQTAYQGA